LRKFLVVADIFALMLGKAVEEDADLPGLVCDDRTETAGAASARPSHALFDDAATKVRVDLITFGPTDGISECRVVDPLTAREAGKCLGLEYPLGFP
jgi:hypothetical protein